MTKLSKAKIQQFEKTLRTRLAELVEEADELTKELVQEEVEHFPDPTDQAVMELDRSRQLRFKDRERKLIRKIEGAIRRIEDGTYGECVTCGAQIDLARLEARPMTDLCIDCATEAEGEKKRNLAHGTSSGPSLSLE